MPVNLFSNPDNPVQSFLLAAVPRCALFLLLFGFAANSATLKYEMGAIVTNPVIPQVSLKKLPTHL